MRKLFTLIAVSLFAMAGMAQVVFTETFSGCNGTGGNDGKWSSFTALSGATLSNAATGWSGTYAYAGSKCARAGGSKKGEQGVITSPSISVTGKGELRFKAGGWNAKSDATRITLSVTGATLVSNEQIVNGVFEVEKGKWTDYVVQFEGANGAVSFTLTGEQNKSCRFFFDEMVVTQLPTTFTINISDLGYSTLFVNQAFVMPENVTPYIVKQDGGNIKLEQVVENVVAANVPLLLKAAPGEYTAAVSSEAGVTPAGNLLKGVLTETTVSASAGNKIYILNTGANGVGFYWQQGSSAGATATVPAGRCYLDFNVTTAAGAQGLSFESLLTGIQTVEKVSNSADIYDLAGRRVQQVGRGLYIVDGKKVIR